MQDFMEALLNVESRYIAYPKGDDENEKKQCERVFAYELYHQYRDIMQKAPERYSGIYLNGDISKADAIYDDIFKFCPDLVLHGHPGKIEDGKQYFLCEMKTWINRWKYKEDLEKLTQLSHSKLGFQDYIFLAIGDSLQDMKDCVKDFTPYCCNIWCVCISKDADKVEYARLFELKQSLAK